MKFGHRLSFAYHSSDGYGFKMPCMVAVVVDVRSPRTHQRRNWLAWFWWVLSFVAEQPETEDPKRCPLVDVSLNPWSDHPYPYMDEWYWENNGESKTNKALKGKARKALKDMMTAFAEALPFEQMVLGDIKAVITLDKWRAWRERVRPVPGSMFLWSYQPRSESEFLPFRPESEE